MKKTGYCLIFFFVSFKIVAQTNLVPNYSFELFSNCPNNFGQITYSDGWYSATTGGSPDYFNSCSLFSSGFDVPNTAWGLQSSHTGNAFVGIYVFGASPPPSREYIQIKLLEPLVKDKKYNIRFYVNLSDISTIAITQIGMYISDFQITSSNSMPLTVIPQVLSPLNFFMTDTLNWFEVSSTYIALGNEEYITIGNFKDELTTDTLHVGVNSPLSYYFIDDVSVVQFDSLDTAVNNIELNFVRLYPNPTSNQITITYQIKSTDIALFEIYNLIGEKVLVQSLNANENEQTFSVQQLSSGIYSYKYSINGTIVKTDKLVIAK